MSAPVIEFRSPDSTTVIYACGNCRLTTAGGPEAAERCCVCTRCGGLVDRKHYVTCRACDAAIRAEKDAARTARLMAKEPVEHDGPVFAAERFYEDAYAAAEAVWDDGGDPTEVIAHPCTVSKTPTPDLAEFVEESWCSQFEDPDDITLTKAAREALVAVQRVLEAEAPVMWTPRTSERVVLPEVRERAS